MKLEPNERLKLKRFAQQADLAVRIGAYRQASKAMAAQNLVATLSKAGLRIRQFNSADQTLAMRASRIFTDYLHGVGSYKDAERLLTPFFELPYIKNGDQDWLREYLWIKWSCAISKHRSGDGPGALTRTQELLAIAPDLSGPHYEFLARLWYAHARNLQACDQFDEVEHAFTKAIDNCVALARRGTADEAACANRIQGLVYAQLARIELARGSLVPAWRTLQGARVLQRQNIDSDVHLAFILMLEGIILRQQHNLRAAQARLRAALRTFRKIGHWRYEMRSLYDLCLAAFSEQSHGNSPDCRRASLYLHDFEAVLARARSTGAVDSKADRLREWEVRAGILRARIARAEGKPEAANAAADRAVVLLGMRRSSHTFTELRVISAALKAELLVDDGKLVEALEACAEGERAIAAATGIPVDASDEAWLHIAKWKAYRKLGDRPRIAECRRQWEKQRSKVENHSFRTIGEQLYAYGNDYGEGFYVPADGSQLPPGGEAGEEYSVWRWKDALVAFLVAEVNKRFENETVKQRAARLGWSAPTLANWTAQDGDKDEA